MVSRLISVQPNHRFGCEDDVQCRIEDSAFTEKGLKMQLFHFPGFCTARSMKLQIQLTYSIPEKAYGLRNVDEKTRRFILTMSHVIKVKGKFHVLDNIIPQKTEQIQMAIF